MKKFSLFALAAAGLLLGACADKDAVLDENSKSFGNGKSESFFKINVNLPTDLSGTTRATEWGEASKLDDGLPAEYQIDNILLLLFEGANESAATLKQVIQLTDNQTDYEDTPNQITTRGTYIAKLNGAPSSNLYALAVVNGGSVISYTNETAVAVGSGAETTSLGTTSTIEDLRNAGAKVVSASVGSNPFVYEKEEKTYFFMTNAVLSTKQGGIESPSESPILTTLAAINADCIYESEAAAQLGNAATDIYVERAMAKVTVDGVNADTKAITVNAGVKKKGGAAITATLLGWTLDNTNTQSYILHKVPAAQVWNLKTLSTTPPSDPYRFIGTYPVFSGQSLYRTYWAEDPNYNSDGTFSLATESDFTNGVGTSNPKYCFENTFDVAHQIHKETTRVLFKVQLNTTEPAYTIGIDKKTLYAESDLQDVVKSDLMNQPGFVEWWNTNGKEGETLTASDITVHWYDGTTAGEAAEGISSATTTVAGVKKVYKIVIASAKLKDSPSLTAISTPDQAIISTLNSQLGKVELYKGGVAYYQVRVKHFGDILTPWNSNEYKVDANHPEYAPKESTIATIYPDADDNRQDANYLGRYGMVRNNWYLISVGEIVGFGSAVVPELPTHPDDELEEMYIKARINILSWAKRPQNWNLK